MTKDHGQAESDLTVAQNSQGANHGKHVVLVGCGAIGSAVAPHLGRMRGVTAVTLIDSESYEARNLSGQDILPGDVGLPKAIVQARRLRRINPRLRVDAVVGSVEDVPLGVLRGDVVVTGLDSRLARQIVNDRCFFLGIPWIDAGVEAEGSLAQVAVYVPGDGRGCLECSWSERDRELLEQTYPCQIADGHAIEPAATNAPSSLAALAASLLSIECERLIHSPEGTESAGFSILIDAAHHQYYVTRVVHNATCRMPWHGVARASIRGVCRCTATLETLFDEGAAKGRRNGQPAENPAPAVRLRVVGHSFVTAMTCPACANRHHILHLRVSLGKSPAAVCDRCKSAMVTTGFDATDEIDRSNLSSETLQRSLESIGIRPGDIVRVTPVEGDPFDVEIRGGRRRKRR